MLQLESIDNAYSFHSYDEHSAKLIKPNNNIHTNHSIDDDLIEISTTTIIYKDLIDSNDLPASFNEFNKQYIEKLVKHDADIFLIGTGSSCRFPDKSILQYIADNKLSIDFMDIGAASRTFNILASEYRKVAALIFFK
ncbi:MAG: hypothetical protein KZQ70_04750 [gamma proteobacterium symbiont of Lucinoma myriamae]|nr:hypothetical protein [gamma proteobacterium symbiont of Lucinoma myriamae]MCU7819078.1 hypothetical protein [gamma proteobacterium symbiont of Lucinoma myriamae]MCU7831846.1 hypothetical protein [gamma proteobacterium symbiont of Lucinoma myriamae]